MRPRSLALLCLLMATLAGRAEGEVTPVTWTITVVAKAHRPVGVTRHRVHARRAQQPFVCGRPGPRTAYDRASGVSFDGRIVKALFGQGRTVLILRDASGQTCAYLPGRTDLARHGVDPAQLQPRTQVEVDGFAHRSNRRKVLVEQLTVHPRG